VLLSKAQTRQFEGCRGENRMTTSDTEPVNPQESGGLGFFERHLTVWVAICILLGVFIGTRFPGFPEALSKLEYAHVWIPVAVLIWFMIYPMMVQIDFGSIVRAGRNPRGLIVTLVVNWVIKPFTMFGLAWLFLKVIFVRWIPADLASQYVAGAIFLGAAPCTAMVFVRISMDTPITPGKSCPLQILAGSCINPYHISNTDKERHLHHCAGFQGRGFGPTACSVTT
jgi:hypothetical protein